MENINLTAEEYTRFQSYVSIIENGCWEWSGNKDKDGYGIFLLRRKNRRAHRVSYYAFVGMIPYGLVVHHTCKNRCCVNPEHLKPVSARENALVQSNGVGAINAQKIKCKNDHPFDKFYGGQRYCSVCEKEKGKRLRSKWNSTPLLIGI